MVNISSMAAQFISTFPYTTKTDIIKHAPIPEGVKKGEFRTKFAQEVLRQITLRRTRQKQQQAVKPLQKALLDQIETGLSEAFKLMFHFRRASMGNYFTVSYRKGIEMPYISVTKSYDRDGYSKSCAWSAVNYTFTLCLPYGYTFEQIGGVLTVFKGRKMPNRNVVTSCYWFKQSRGMELTAVSGFLFKEFHVEAASAEAAKKKVVKIRKAAAIEQLKTRARINQRRIETTLKLKKESFRANIDLKSVFVTVADARKAGNCLAGIEAWATRHQVDLNQIGGISADFLMKLTGNDQLQRVSKSVGVALNRVTEIRFN